MSRSQSTLQSCSGCGLVVRPIRTFFSYTPRSGSRVIAAQPTQDILILESAFGTYAAGDFITFSLSAAEPGRWWRNTACRLAEQIVAAIGGLAEDCQGAVSICFPAAHTAGIAREIKALARWYIPPAEIDHQCWQQEAAVLAVNERSTIEYWYPGYDQIQRIKLEVIPGFARRSVRIQPEEAAEMHGVEFRTAVYRSIWVVDRRAIGPNAYNLIDSAPMVEVDVGSHAHVHQVHAVPITAKDREVRCHAPIGSLWGDGAPVSSHTSLAWPENLPRPAWAGWEVNGGAA